MTVLYHGNNSPLNEKYFYHYESSLQNVLKILPTSYQYETKVPEKSSKFLVWLEGEVSFIQCVQEKKF